MAKHGLAHDLSVVSTATQQQQRVQKKPALKVVRSQRAFAGAFTPRVVFAFALVMTLASLMVYNRVYLNELTREINTLNSQLAILESENLRYSSLLESSVSLRAIAQQAEEMGMVRGDVYRTTYIYLYEGDQIIHFGQQEQQEYIPSRLLAMLASIISNAKEYLAGS